MSASENANLTCRNCGRQCLAGDSFCPSCGLPLDPVKSVRVREKKPRSAIVSRLLSVKFFRNAAILLLSVLVLLTAFLPCVKMDTGSQMSEAFGLPIRIELRYSGIDFITFFIDNLHNETAEEMKESRLGDRVLDLEAEIEQELTGLMSINDLTPRQKRLLDRYLHLTMRLTLRSEDTALAPNMLFAAVTSLLYMMFALAFFTVALLNLLLHLFDRRDLFSATVRFLCLVPGAGLVLHFAARACLGTVLPVRPAGALLAAIITSFVLTLAVMVIGLATRTVRFRTGALVRTLLVSVSAFVMLSVLLLSPLSIKLTGDFSARENTPVVPGWSTSDETTGTTEEPKANVTTVKVRLDWSFFDTISMTQNDLKDFDQKTADALNELGDYERSDYSRGTMVATSVLHTATAYALRLATGDGSGMDVFAFLPVIAFLAALAAAWVLGEGLLYLATGRCKRQTYTAAKLSACILSFLLLILLIVTVVVFNATMKESNIKALADNEVFASVVGENGLLRRMIHMQLGAAPIVVTVFSLLALLLPLPIGKQSKAVPLPLPEEDATPVAE